jgi:hypothetical protein
LISNTIVNAQPDDKKVSHPLQPAHVPSSKYPSKILVGRFQKILQNWRKKEEVTTVETHIPIKASCKTLVAHCRN